MDGLKRTCQLLRNRVEDDALSLLQEFAPWVMKKAPEEGLCNYTFRRSENVICYGLPYSEHSSFEELREFLRRVHYRDVSFVAESGKGDLFERSEKQRTIGAYLKG